MNNRRRVVVTGLGVLTSIGIGWPIFWKNLLQGTSGISEITSLDTSAHFTHKGGEIRNFDSEQFIQKNEIPYLSRATQLAFAAARMATDDARLGGVGNKCISVCLGTTNGPTQAIEHVNDFALAAGSRNKDQLDRLLCRVPTNSAPAFISKKLNFKGSNYIFSTACAAGNYAIGFGYDLICLGRSDVVLAGGSDPFIRFAFTGFNQFSAVAPEKCRPFDKNRKGMMVAEGAAFLVLESLESAMQRGVPIYAELLGYGLSCDAYHMTTGSVDGIAQCMKNAMTASGITPADVSYISAHGTGTPANDRNECAAIKNVFGEASKRIPISSIKSMLGHSMGAASAIEAVSCALAVKDDIIPPTMNYETPDPECDIDCVPNMARRQTVNIALNNAYAFGGNNACVVFKKFSE